MLFVAALGIELSSSKFFLFPSFEKNKQLVGQGEDYFELVDNRRRSTQNNNSF